MPRAARSQLSPWIENLILSYGEEDRSSSSSSSGRLKAHVIGVGQMTQSQAQGSESPTGLLFLSDGVLQLPAVLTASAWEHLQDQEERESFSSLLNTTVWIQDYRLQFHMAQEQTKCRFFLSVGELATTAAGPGKDNTPCCTSLPSVRLKICKTWRALLSQETQDSQASQCGFDLSELLGEWQLDCLQTVLEDIREMLVMACSRPVSPQPSTSTCTALLTDPGTSAPTSWDIDRIKYKDVKCFSVPVKCLLIPEEDALQMQTAQDVVSGTPDELPAASEDRRDLSRVCKPSESSQPSVGDAEWRLGKPTAAVPGRDAPLSAEESMLHEDMITLIDDIRPLSNPWDIFPPPCDTSSCSDVSSEATPTCSLQIPAAAESNPESVAVSTSTQLPVHGLKTSWQTSEHSYLPPFQKLPHSPGVASTGTASASNSVGTSEPFTRPPDLQPAPEELHTGSAQQKLASLDQESPRLETDMEETTERKSRKAKRKRSEPTPEVLTALVDEEEEDTQISGSPPSWLFDSQAKEDAHPEQAVPTYQTIGTVSRRTPGIHSDGRPFSYSYQVSGQNLQDFSQFRVAASWQHWAVKYLLVPKQTEELRTASLTSTRTSSDRTEVTSLLVQNVE